MTPWWSFIVVPVCLSLALLFGYWLGKKHQERVCDEQERMVAQIDPPNRTLGVPTNTDAEPSEVRRARWRSGEFRSGPDADPRSNA